MLKRVGECWPIPRGYAPAWRDVRTNEAVCAPVGLHLVIGWCRKAYFWLMMACVADAYTRAFDAGFLHGVNHGRACDEEVLQARYRQGHSDGMKAMADAIQGAFKL